MFIATSEDTASWDPVLINQHRRARLVWVAKAASSLWRCSPNRDRRRRSAGRFCLCPVCVALFCLCSVRVGPFCMCPVCIAWFRLRPVCVFPRRSEGVGAGLERAMRYRDAEPSWHAAIAWKVFPVWVQSGLRACRLVPRRPVLKC